MGMLGIDEASLPKAASPSAVLAKKQQKQKMPTEWQLFRL